jgi:hypothetical protein
MEEKTMFSMLGIDYTRQRLENATRCAERAAQHRFAQTRWRRFGRGARPRGGGTA